MTDPAVRKLAKIVADQGRQIKGLSGGPQAAYSSIEGGSMDAYDRDGKMRLRIGAQDDGTHAVKYVQGPPPPRPTAPVVSVDGPVVRVRWDGVLMGGHIPEDFSRIDVHFALASEDLETDDAVRGNLATSAGNETTLMATQTGTYRVGLVAMSQSRARSDMSETVDVEVTLVDLEGALDAVVENARGGSNFYAPEPPSGTNHDPARDLWFDTSADEDGLTHYTPHRWDGQQWVSLEDERVEALKDAQEQFGQDLTEAEARTIAEAQALADQARSDAASDATAKSEAARDAAISEAETKDQQVRSDIDGVIDQARSDLEAEIATVRTSVDGKNRITQSVDAPPAQYDGAVGDRWERMSSMGSGGSLIANWRWNGNVWVSTVISDAVLGNVDAAKIGTGYLGADRIKAGSITADKMIIGSDENLLPIGAVDSGATTEPHRAMSGAALSHYTNVGRGFQNTLYVQRAYASDVRWDHILRLSSGGLSGALASGHYFPVAGGRTYRADVDFVKSGTTGPHGSPNARLSLVYYRIDGTWLGAHESNTALVSNWDADPARHVSVIAPAPEGAAWLGLTMQSDRQGNVALVRPRLTEMKGATLIEDGAITTDKVAANAIEAGKIATGAVKAEHIVAGGIEAESLIVSGSVGETLIQDGAISTRTVQADAIGAEAIAAGVIDADHIIAGGILADSVLVPGSVGSTLIEDGAITTDKILADAITAESGIIGSLDLGVATVGYLNGARIEAGTIDTPQLAFGSATGDILSVDALNFKTAQGLDIRSSSFRAGDSVEITEDFGIRQFGPDGALNVSLPSDGAEAEFRGDLSARTLTATGRMSIQGPGAIASGGVLELESGVVPPVAGPQITNVWDRTVFPPLSDQEAPTGLAWADGHFWRCVTTSVRLSDGGRTRIEKITPTGELAGGWDTTFRVGVDGITILNGELYVLAEGRYLDMPGNPDRAVIVYNLQGVEQRRWADTLYTPGTYQQGIGNDGTNIILAKSWNDGILRWRKWTPNGTYLETLNSGRVMKSNVTQVLYGEFDYADGPKRIVAQQRTDLKAFVCYDAAPTSPDDVGRSWNAADFQNPVGLAWDGSRFHSLTPQGDLVSYQSHETGRFVGDDEDDWWAATSWQHEGQQTTVGPATRFRYLHRSQVRVQTGDAPIGAGGYYVYLAKTPDVPVRTDLHWVWRLSDAESWQFTMGDIVDFWAGTESPPTINTFTTGAPGEIHSAIGAFRVDGTGAGSWGPLTFNADGSMDGPISHGVVNIPAVAGSNTFATVTLPVGKYSSPPTVTTTAESSDLTSTRATGVRNVTTTSFDLVLLRMSAETIPVHWIAMGD